MSGLPKRIIDLWANGSIATRADRSGELLYKSSEWVTITEIKDDLFPDTDVPSLEKYGIAFAEWLIPSTSTPFRKGIIKKILEYEDLELVDNSRKKIYQCGGSNSYKSIKVGVASHGEMTTIVRTNIQEIANGNGQLDQYGYMFGKWIKKNADSYFLSGLFKALTEGYNDK
jgi:hypothetical protein